MKLTNREKVLLPLVLIFVLSALFINFVYLPISKELKDLEIQTQDMSNKILEVKAKETELKNLRAQTKDLSAQIEKGNEDILPIWDQAELLAHIEKLIANQADKKSIDFFDVVSLNHLQAGEVDMTFNTNYSNLQNIMSKLSKSKFFNTVPGCKVDKIETGSGEETDLVYDLEVGLKLKFYAMSLQQTYPDKYDFMTGSFGKKDLFR